jgi:hypothetical protein
MTRKRWFRVIALACFLILLGAAGAWYFLDRMISAAMHMEHHAVGTYYFNSFRGGVLGPFQPLDEISRDEAMARDGDVVGVFSEDG